MGIENEFIQGRDDVRKYLTNHDNSKKLTFGFVNKFDEPSVVGIDEAGRGPVLGPMVYGICYYPLQKADIFKNLGCADSKSLNDEKRESIFGEICKQEVGWCVEAISPIYICNSMLRRKKCSLNEVALESTVHLIQTIVDSGTNIAEIYIDTVGMPDKHQEKLLSFFPHLKIVVAKKADATYPAVSAASICAKVVRDTALQAWVFREDCNIDRESFGSGYPNDPTTKKFLMENIDPIFGFPELVRFSWSTAEKILQNNSVLVEWEDAEESEDRRTQSITSFFRTSQKKQLKHPFFKGRHLISTESI